MGLQLLITVCMYEEHFDPQVHYVILNVTIKLTQVHVDGFLLACCV